MPRRPRIIVTHLAPRDMCLNLFGLLLTRDASWIDATVIRHERIHDLQQRELLWIPFYIIYVLEWLYRLARLRNSRAAYRAISFEREAYANASRPDYLTHRRPYAQWRH